MKPRSTKRRSTGTTRKSRTSRGSPKATTSSVDRNEQFPRQTAEWLKKDEAALVKAIKARQTINEISAALQRSPASVLLRLDACGVFEFERGSDEEAELFGLCMAGVPVLEAVRWCAASDERLPFAQIDALRSGADLRPAFYLARDCGLWSAVTAEQQDLAWLAKQSSHSIAAAAKQLREAYDAPTVRRVRETIESPSSCPAQPYALTSAFRVDSPEPAPATRGRTSSTRTSTKSSAKTSRKRWSGKRRGSSSYPSGAPVVDRRTAAERAWENRTHW